MIEAPQDLNPVREKSDASSALYADSLVDEQSQEQNDLVQKDDQVEENDDAPEGPPEPTAEQVQEMQRLAVDGRLNDTAAAMAVRALVQNGPAGLTQLRDQLNQHLTNQNSDYQARIARVDGQNGEIHFYMLLQRQNENLNAMVRDIHENQDNSRYAPRAVGIHLIPQEDRRRLIEI